MSKNQKKLYIGIFIVIFFTVFVSFIYRKEKTSKIEIITTNKSDIQETEVPSPEIKTQTINTTTKESGDQQNPEENNQSVTVLAGETTIRLSFSDDTTFYNALVQAKNTSQIEFSGKNYPGLGFFVTNIGTLHSGNGKHLLYYINGKEATVGVSSYTLKDGDIIEWKLE